MKSSRLDRRHVLGMMAVAAWSVRLPAVGAVETAGANDNADALIRALTAASPLREGRVRLAIPSLADTGHSVPVTIEVDSPMTSDDFVKGIHLIAPRNPRPMVAVFTPSLLSGRALFSTRIRLAGEQDVIAIALHSDGAHSVARAHVVVTASACIDGT